MISDSIVIVVFKISIRVEITLIIKFININPPSTVKPLNFYKNLKENKKCLSSLHYLIITTIVSKLMTYRSLKLANLL